MKENVDVPRDLKEVEKVEASYAFCRFGRRVPRFLRQHRGPQRHPLKMHEPREFDVVLVNLIRGTKERMLTCRFQKTLLIEQ
jgi:hypothetical protein